MDDQQAKTAYTFVIDPFGLEVTVVAATEKQARDDLWAHYLSEGVKNGCESIECVEQRALA
jgi:hypothetical protein